MPEDGDKKSQLIKGVCLGHEVEAVFQLGGIRVLNCKRENKIGDSLGQKGLGRQGTGAMPGKGGTRKERPGSIQERFNDARQKLGTIRV